MVGSADQARLRHFALPNAQEKRQFLLECHGYCRLKMALLLNVG